MPRQRSPNRDKAYQLWQESGGSLLLKDIAAQLGVSESQIRKWKNQDKWEQSGMVTLPNTKSNVTKPQALVTAEEKSLVESVMANGALTEKQRLFCLYYVKCFNATKAYQKAYACSYETAASVSYRLLENDGVRAEIKRLKQNRMNQVLLEPEDIFQKYLDIAFADITDFVQFGQEEVQVTTMFGPAKDEEGNPITKKVNTVKFNNSSQVDGTIITEVKQGKDGASIKLADRMKALDWLANHMDLATEEQRTRIAKLQADINKIKGEDLSKGQVQEFIAAVKLGENDVRVLFEDDADEEN